MARMLSTCKSLGVRSLSIASLHATTKNVGTSSGVVRPWGQIFFTLATAATTLYTLTVAYFYTFEREDVVIDNICSVFERGGAPGWDRDFEVDLDPVARVPRPALQAQLLALFSPELSSPAMKRYAVVVGACGTGKSSALRLAVRAQGEIKSIDSLPTSGGFTPQRNWFYGPPVKKGVVYFLAPTGITSFSTDLMRALECQEPFRLFPPSGQQGPLPQPVASWRVLAPLLQAAATRFKSRHGRPAVLVLDAMDLVAKHDPLFLAEVQDFAKVCADKGTLRIVFVMGEGLALPLLQSNHAFFRATRPFEIGDISDAEAVKFLEGQRVEVGRARELVREATGGRFPLLYLYADSTMAVKDIVDELHRGTREVLKEIRIAPGHPLFRALLEKKKVSLEAAVDILGYEKISTLLKQDILAAHPDRTYSFYSRHVESFFAGKCGL